MILGQVTGNIWATRKDEGLKGYKLMVIELVNKNGDSLHNEIIAVDTVGAGVGDTVLITRGSPSRLHHGSAVTSPIDAAIVGIVDSVD